MKRRLTHALAAVALTGAAILGTSAFTSLPSDAPGDTAWTQPADTAWSITDTVTDAVDDVLATLRDTAW